MRDDTKWVGLLLLLHVLPAALQRTVAALGDNDLRTAFAAEVHLPELISHDPMSVPRFLFRLLFAVKHRLPFLQERCYPLAPIARCLQQDVKVLFEADALVER